MRHEEQLNDLAAHEIAALEADGIRLTAAEIVQLNALGWAVETPEARRHLARGVPVPVGGVYLWPQTLRAYDWLERASGHCGDKEEVLATAYSMAFAYSEGAELDSVESDAIKAVKKWSKRLLATPSEIKEAVEQVMSQVAGHDLPKSPADDKPMSVGDFSAFLAATNGGDPEFWERRCSIGYGLAFMSNVVKQNAADGKPTAMDPKIQAVQALGLSVEKIRARAAVAEPSNG